MLHVTWWRAWFIALCLIIFDILVISAVVNRPVDRLSDDRSGWDFRIAELRQLETTSGTYDVTKIVRIAPQANSALDSHRSPQWLATYFPDSQAQHAAATGFWRQMIVVTPAALPAKPSANDAFGQVL